MKSTVIRKGATASIILGLGALLSACGGGGGGSSAASGDTITGYTMDGAFSASIVVYGFEGTSSVSCGSGTSLASNTGYFSIPLNPSCSGPYLVVATASSGTDAGTYYYLTSQSLPSNPIYVTPASTAIVKANLEGINSTTTAILSSLSSLISSSSSILSSIEQQESQYSGSNLSFTHVFFSYSDGTTVFQYLGAEIIELTYPTNYSSNTVPVVVKEFFGKNVTFFPPLTIYSYFSTTGNDIGTISSNIGNISQTFIFSGNLNNPSSLTLSTSFTYGSFNLSDSTQPKSCTIMNSYTSPIITTAATSYTFVSITCG